MRAARIALVLLALCLACKSRGGQVYERVEDGVILQAPGEAEQAAIGRFVVARLADEEARTLPELPASLRRTPAVAYVALRSHGVVLRDAWGPPADAALSLSAALESALDGLEQPELDYVEIALAHDFHAIEPATPEQLRKLLNDNHVGIRGVELSYGDTVIRVSPTTMVTGKRSFAGELERFSSTLSLDAEELALRGAVRHFRARQLIVQVPSGTTTLLFRGNAFVPASAVSRERAEASAELAGEWLLANLDDEGRLADRVQPHGASEAPGKDPARSWQGTRALIQLARRRGDAALWQRLDRHLEQQLATWYREVEGLGLIAAEPGGKLDVPGLALASLALREHPERARWAAQEQALARTIAKRCHASADCSGEVSLLWAERYASDEDPDSLRRFALAHRVAQARWREQPEHRSPTRLAWQVLAVVRMESLLHAAGEAPPELAPAELAAWALESCDWLISELAVWDKPVYEDEKGRFHSRARKDGPPSVATTGLVLQALLAARPLAERLGDHERSERYRRTAARALRSLLQLQFADEDDLFFVRKRERTRGGFRTSVVDNEVRIDNVSQPLFALWAMLEGFSPADYRCD